VPTLYQVKPAFQATLRPLVGRLASLGVTANQVTVAAAVISIAAALLVVAFPDRPAVFLLLPVVLFLRMALNAIDGMLAREHGQASKLGMYLNEICDVISDLALILAFLAVPGLAAWSVVGFALLAVIVEFTGVLGLASGIGRNYAGPFGKSDRALALAVVAILIAAGYWTPVIGTWIFAAMAILSAITVANRIRAGLSGGVG
jgi:CDP-diacylglycerol--glycerol-3-phosphate 3-phosphatidyltransferase